MNDSLDKASAGNSTTLRPRNRHRSIENDEGRPSLSNPTTNWLDGPSLSSASSRAISPIPSTNPSRPSRSDRDPQRSRSTSRFLGVPNLLGSQVTSTNFTTGLWESSWSSLQGIASTLIGNDSSRSSSPARPAQRKARPLEGTSHRYTRAQPAQWGPSTPRDKQVGAGSKEDRRIQVQAKKREALLAANGHVTSDTLRRYKRRDSDDSNAISVPPGDNEDRDALVYLHKVRPADTLAGIMIKYNCDSNVFRKANRLWPNDSIQVRKIVVLPVEACGVRGQRIAEPNSGLDLVSDGINKETMSTPVATQAPWHDLHTAFPNKKTPISSIPTSPSISVSLSNLDDPPWKHDSWVQIDGFTDAVEIARLSRKTLGYFPCSRRKSQTFSDLETPTVSLDLPRVISRAHSPRGGQRTKSRSSSGTFLQGPGGVGTMNRNVRGPGPAQDGLNKLFAKHLPDVAPRSSFESVESESESSRGNGIENLGGAVEGWVRKIATKAANTVQPPTPGGKSGIGDLIELSEDPFGVGVDEEGEGINDRCNAITENNVGFGASAMDREQERIMHERFPPRGRIVTESPRRGQGR